MEGVIGSVYWTLILIQPQVGFGVMIIIMTDSVIAEVEVVRKEDLKGFLWSTRPEHVNFGLKP